MSCFKHGFPYSFSLSFSFSIHSSLSSTAFGRSSRLYPCRTVVDKFELVIQRVKGPEVTCMSCSSYLDDFRDER